MTVLFTVASSASIEVHYVSYNLDNQSGPTSLLWLLVWILCACAWLEVAGLKQYKTTSIIRLL